MKKLFFFCSLLFVSIGLSAQEAPQDSSIIDHDSTKQTKVTEFSLSLGKKNVKTRFLMLDLGVNSYGNEGNLNLPTTLETYELRHGRSIEVNLHVYRQRIKIGKGYFNIEHGFSFDFNHYAFQNPVTFNTDPTEEFVINNNLDIQRSRLFISNMVLPLMLHFETNPKRLSKSFHFGVGAYGALRLGSNLKTRDSDRGRNKIVNNFDLNDFSYGLRAEMGYGPINLYTKVAFIDLFKDGTNRPNLTPFSVGFVLIPF